MTYEQGLALMPFLLAAMFGICALIWAMIRDDGAWTERRRYAEAALDGLRWTRYEPGRVVAGRGVPTLAGSVGDTLLWPFGFQPEPTVPGDESPLGGEVEGDPDADEVSDDEPVPAPADQWPVPQLLPQPVPTPVEPLLFEQTGAYPAYPEWVDHTGMTGVIPRLPDEMWAGV